jgi:hypothetical protein
VIGATALMIAAVSFFVLRPGVHAPAPTGVRALLAPTVEHDLDPTISNYQIVANRSLEELEELLTRQGNRNPPPTPLYTASSRPRANVAD